MSDHGYAVFDDPYCYPGTFVLKNRADLRDARRLQAFELEMSALRAEEPLPNGRFGPAHYCAVHRHLFGDVYSWAGKYRTVRTAKGGNVFCYPEHIDAQMTELFTRLRQPAFKDSASARAFVGSAAAFLAELNALHPFREGNGRAQLAFMRLVSVRAGHALDFAKLRSRAFLTAMIKSFDRELGPLEGELRKLL
ncbi:MAG: Fic family protein [Phycisphaerales bacterium]|nr:Fic family protein [Hyphomonadaceae bacterium]